MPPIPKRFKNVTGKPISYLIDLFKFRKYCGNVSACLKSSNSEACAAKLSQILANNIGNSGTGIVPELM